MHSVNFTAKVRQGVRSGRGPRVGRASAVRKMFIPVGYKRIVMHIRVEFVEISIGCSLFPIVFFSEKHNLY